MFIRRARNKSSKMMKISRKAAVYCFFHRVVCFFCVRAQDTHNVDSRSTPRKNIQFQSKKRSTKNRSFLERLRWDVEYFLCRILQWMNIVHFCQLLLLRCPHHHSKLKSHLWKAFYSWTIWNLFVNEIESLSCLPRCVVMCWYWRG